MRPILPLLGICSALWLFLGTWWLSGQICGASSTTTLTVSDGQFLTKAQGLIAFDKNETKPLATVETEKSLQAIAQHLTDNPQRMLMLSGLFGSKETFNKPSENLGIARAEAIKAILVGHGADAERINTSGQRLDNLIFKDNRLEEAVNFTFSELPLPVEKNQSTSDATNESVDGEYVIYFPAKAVDYKADSDLKEYINYLRAYLDANPGTTIEVIGHTAKAGHREKMKKMAERRARKVRSFFRKDNLFKSKEVAPIGKGYDEPLVDHESAAAAEKNNRVVIRIVD